MVGEGYVGEDWREAQSDRDRNGERAIAAETEAESGKPAEMGSNPVLSCGRTPCNSRAHLASPGKEKRRALYSRELAAFCFRGSLIIDVCIIAY